MGKECECSTDCALGINLSSLQPHALSLLGLLWSTESSSTQELTLYAEKTSESETG